jgi:hypothetical protein
MPIQTINIGNYANDGLGDDLRTAFEKVNANFDLLNTTDTTAATNVGTGSGVFAQKSGTTLQFKSLIGGSNITLSSNGTSITINGSGNLSSETSPSLGGNLNMGGFNITNGGDVQSTVYGLDIRTMNNLLQLLATTNNFLDLDLGSFTNPNTSQFDLGTF